MFVLGLDDRQFAVFRALMDAHRAGNEDLSNYPKIAADAAALFDALTA
jgi:hypothetical protein